MITYLPSTTRLAGVLASCAALLFALTASAEAQTVRSRVGISIAWSDNDQTIDDDVVLAKTLGVGYVRTDLHWDDVETVKGQFDWTGFDAKADAIKSANMNVLAVLDYNNPLYASAWNAGYYNEANVSAYSRFAVAAVKRYHGPMFMFELYNEPNQNEYWETAPPGQLSTAAQYVNIVKATMPAIRAAIPDAEVMAPGLGHNPIGPNLAPWENELLDFPYLKSAFDRGLLSYTSKISVHPYPDQSQQPENTLGVTYTTLQNLISQYSAAMPVSIYNSETGYNTKPSESGVTDAQQSVWLPRHILLDMYFGTASTTIFTLRDSPSSESAYFGLIRADGTKKPVFAAVQKLLRELGELTYTRRLPSHPGDWLLEFSGAGKTVVAGWTTRDPHTVTVAGKKMMISDEVRYMDASEQSGRRPGVKQRRATAPGGNP